MWNDELKNMKKKSGLTTAQIAAQSGIPEPTLEKLFAGTTKEPKLETMRQLVHFLGHTLDDLYPPEIKSAPTLPEDALQVAKDYMTLDGYGKQAVRDLIGNEQRRCEDEARFLTGAALQPDPIVINLYSEPAAAGVAVPTMGKDYTSYELAPGDPKGAAYAVRVQGDSMEPAFRDGDIAFVNHDALRNGDIGVFCVDGGTVIKQYYHDPLGMTYLFSLNRKRSDADVLIYPSSGQTVVCQGRVITPRRYPLPPLG